MNKLNFSQALEALKEGKKLARYGWNGKDMWIILILGTEAAQLKEGSPYKLALNQDTSNILSHIDMRTATGDMQPGWLASQSDILANDWQIID